MRGKGTTLVDMKRLILITILFLLLMASPALAVTYQGGTEAQRAYAQEIVESCLVDYSRTDARLDGVDITFAATYEPYWEHLDNVSGLAWPGHIVVDSSFVPAGDSFFGEIIAHEWCHQVWYSLPYLRQQEWVALVGTGDKSVWLLSPAENFAECMRVALFAPGYYLNDYPRTSLKVVSVDDARAFLGVGVHPRPRPAGGSMGKRGGG